MTLSTIPTLPGPVVSAAPVPATHPSTTESTAPTAPAAAIVVTHEVADFNAWKAVFDTDATTRKRHHVTQTHVNQSADNPNLVTVYIAADTAAALQELAADPDLAAAMNKAGVKGPPTVIPITPTEDRTVKDRALAGAIIRFHVASYDAWKTGFDGNADARTQAGVIGHAINRVSADPDTVVVYLQSESIDALRTFTSSPELRAVQQRAGVQGPPQISFWQGGAWAH